MWTAPRDPDVILAIPAIDHLGVDGVSALASTITAIAARPAETARVEEIHHRAKQ
jgi:hypothetical protein